MVVMWSICILIWIFNICASLYKRKIDMTAGIVAMFISLLFFVEKLVNVS